MHTTDYDKNQYAAPTQIYLPNQNQRKKEYVKWLINYPNKYIPFQILPVLIECKHQNKLPLYMYTQSVNL